MLKKFFAEFLATAILVLLGCGTAMAFTFAGYTANFPAAATVGIAAAFGLSIIILAYTVGPISGGHANPAVSFAKALNKEISWKEFCVYVSGQIIGAFFGSLLLAMVMWSWKTGVAGQNGLYSSAGFLNETFWTPVEVAPDTIAFGPGVDGSNPTFMNVMLSTMAEMGMTFLFVIAVLGLTSKKEWSGFAGIGIGLVLFGVHLVGIPLTGTSVNPARALSALVFSMFNGEEINYKLLSLIPAIVGPFMGAFAAWSAFHAFNKQKKDAQPAEEAKAE